jgi:hypothetical protein
MKGNVAKTGRGFRIYKIFSIAIAGIAAAYVWLLCFPQSLFAHSTSYQNYKVYSREPISAEITNVLDRTEARLKSSPIYDQTVPRRVYLTNGFGMYTLLSHKARNSFANNIPYIENIIINKTDLAVDQIIMDREKNNTRSLSGVIAHEVTHNMIQRRYGTATAVMMPTWKKEGYCEYVAGDSTITLDEGIRLWRESPTDDTRYRDIK